MHKNKIYCRTYLQHENYTNTILKSWGWGSGAMMVVSSTLGVGRAGGRRRQRWWGDGVGGGCRCQGWVIQGVVVDGGVGGGVGGRLSMPGVGHPGGRHRRRWWGGGGGRWRWGGSSSPLVVVAVVAGCGRIVDVDGVGSGRVIDAGGGVVVRAVVDAGGGLVVTLSMQVLWWWWW